MTISFLVFTALVHPRTPRSAASGSARTSGFSIMPEPCVRSDGRAVTCRLEPRDQSHTLLVVFLRMRPARIPADVGAIVAASFLAELPGDEVAALLEPGFRIDQEPGRALGGRDEPVVAFLVD